MNATPVTVKAFSVTFNESEAKLLVKILGAIGGRTTLNMREVPLTFDESAIDLPFELYGKLTAIGVPASE